MVQERIKKPLHNKNNDLWEFVCCDRKCAYLHRPINSNDNICIKMKWIKKVFLAESYFDWVSEYQLATTTTKTDSHTQVVVMFTLIHRKRMHFSKGKKKRCFVLQWKAHQQALTFILSLFNIYVGFLSARVQVNNVSLWHSSYLVVTSI